MATVLCLLIAGCGSSSATAFKQGYVKASVPLEQTGADIARAIAGPAHRSPAQIANQFAGLADRFDSELIQLEALQAPSNVSTGFKTIIAAANRLDDDLRAISSSASRHDAVGLRSAAEALMTDARAMNSGAGTVRQSLGIK